MTRGFKDNVIVRGLYFGLHKILSWFPNRRKFASCAKSAIVTPPLYVINPKNISIGESCCIGPGAHISALNAKFILKGHSAIAEGLTVHTGNHARIPGMFLTDINETNKPRGYDNDVIIEEDVWIASNVTLLAGVTIGRGTTVAAGAVVTKSMPPYCVCGGVPAKFIKFYWTIDQILEHETILYQEKERYTREELEGLYNKYETV